VPGLRFDLPSFEVRPGARVELTLANTDDMLHNLVVTQPDAADAVAMAAMELGLEGAENGYVPDVGGVLFHTALLQPGTREHIYFTAPETPGDYPYVCTFPGHAFTMRGTMHVAP
jgi:azurin